MSRRRGPFRIDQGEVVVDLPEAERDVLSHLLPQLREMLLAADDPALRRLRPPARPDDPEGEAEYRDMIDDDLLRARLEAIELVEAGIDGTRLDALGVEAWMQSVNSIRLVLGERLTLDDIDLDDPHVDPADDLDDDHPLVVVYEWLGYLLGSLVEAAEEISPPD